MFRFGHNETTWRPFVEQSSATTYAVFVPKEYRLVKEHNKDYDRILNHLEFIVSGRNSAGMGPHNAPTSMHTSGTGTTRTNTTNTTTTTTTTTVLPIPPMHGLLLVLPRLLLFPLPLFPDIFLLAIFILTPSLPFFLFHLCS